MVKLATPQRAEDVLARDKAAYTTVSDPRSAFAEEMRRAGYTPPRALTIGKVDRMPAPGEKGNKKSGWYWYSEFTDDHQPGALIGVGKFSSWKTAGNPIVWSSKRRESMSMVEQSHFDERMRAEKIAREEEQARVHAEAAERAKEIWDKATIPPEGHPYLANKGIQAHGARLSRGEIVLSVMDGDKLMSLQFISTEGNKLFLTGGRVKGCAYKIEGTGEAVYVCEGFATGATVHEATGATVYVAFHAGNLSDVAGTARDAHPEKTIVIAGDDDHKTEGNPGRAKAGEAATQMRCRAVFPDVEGTDTDFNDMAAAKGIEAVRVLLRRESYDAPLNTFTFPADFNPAEIQSRPWIIRGLLLRGYISECIAPPGVGKSMFSLIIAIMAAIDEPLLNRELLETANVLLLNNEDDEDEIKRRVAGICQHYDIPFGKLTGKLHAFSGYGSPLVIARTVDKNTVIATPDKGKLIAFCRENQIGVIVIDPFVSTHDVQENDNTQIEKVATEYRVIAKATGAAIYLVHHTRKIGGNSESHAGDIDAGRGASALGGAVRVVFTLARMDKETAKKKKIDWSLGNRLIRMDDGKTNFALKNEREDWFELVSVRLANGDSVGVPVPFDFAEIEERIDEENAAEKAKQQEDKATDIAVKVAKCMTEDELPQGEVVDAYRTAKNVGRSTANNDIKKLPVGRPNAIKVFIDKDMTQVWRERCGSLKCPRYIVHKLALD